MSEGIAERLRPLEAVVEHLDTTPGTGQYVAEALIAEIGDGYGEVPDCGTPGMVDQDR